MFKNCFYDLFNHNNYTWYAHNLGAFNVKFNILFKNYIKTKIQFKYGKPLSIKVSLTTKDNKTKNIVFKDSYKIQPLSIRNKANDITKKKLFFMNR
jgi:hypothetical protein